MFRYSRDVNRCGPGTKAGAPVGVVYCLSTSSFFILMLTLGLDVSAFGNGDRPRDIFAAFRTGRQYGPLGPPLEAGSLRVSRALFSRRARQIIPRCNTACSCLPLARAGV